MLDIQSVLDCRFAGDRLRAWGGLWMVLMLVLQTAPVRAQENQPDSKAQPAPAAEGSTQPLPAAQESNLSPPTAPEAPAPREDEEPPAPGGLEELLQADVPTDAVGSFGYRLRRYGVNPYIHGVLAVDLWRWRLRSDNRPSRQGFDLRDAHLYFGADILDLVIPELFLEFESEGAAPGSLNLRYAQLDLRLRQKLLVMRSGLFLVPFGTYNTETFPRFITRLAERPEFFREIIPTAWKEVGVQLFGSLAWRPGLSLSYAVYVTNGLEQPEPDDSGGAGVAEGGSLEDFESVISERKNNAKSIGARLRMEFMTGMAVGVSGYTGAYTRDGARRLSMVGFDVTFFRGAFSLELETALARQEVSDGVLNKWGYAAVAAYRLHPMLEPVIAIDEIHLDGAPEEDARTYWGGFNVFPFPDQIPTAVFKATYNARVPYDGAMSHRLTVQLAVGF